MYELYACMKKGASEVPRTHLRACKFSTFSREGGGVPTDPITQSILWAHFLYLPWTPILLVAGPDQYPTHHMWYLVLVRYLYLHPVLLQKLRSKVRTRLACEPLQVLAVDKVSAIPGSPQVTLLLVFVLLIKLNIWTILVNASLVPWLSARPPVRRKDGLVNIVQNLWPLRNFGGNNLHGQLSCMYWASRPSSLAACTVLRWSLCTKPCSQAFSVFCWHSQ